MSRAIAVALAIPAVLACKGSSSDKPTPSPAPAVRTAAAPDALWAHAPDKLVMGFIATPTAIAALDPILDRARALAKDPELAILDQGMRQIEALLGKPDAHVADAGFAPTKGFAFFQTEDGAMFAILPVADRDKVMKTVRGTRGKTPDDPDTIDELACKPKGELYACTKATDLAQLDRLGKGAADVAPRFAALGKRGDLEVTVDKRVLGNSGFDHISLAITLDNGQLALDGLVAGKSPALASLVGAERPKPDTTNAAGFVVANLSPWLELLPERPLPTTPTTWLRELAGTVKGPMIGALSAGALEFRARLPLTDSKLMTGVVTQCANFVPAAYLAPQQQPGTCRVIVPSVVPFEADIWVEGDELRVASNKAAKPAVAIDVMSPTGKELATGDWTYAMWGRGTIVSPDGVPFPPLTQAMPQQATLAIRGLSQLSELGLGVKVDDAGARIRLVVRTIYANPPAVADALAAITADDIMKNAAGAKLEAIAASAPASPFATDVKAGQAGMMVPTMVIGLVAAVAVPAFLDYTKQAKKSEAELQLARLGKHAKTIWASEAKFPTADIPLTPDKSCCESPTRRCERGPGTWKAWAPLDFAIDEPHRFRYSYRGSDGQFVATAVGDLDCDGIEVTYTLTGMIENGAPVLNLVAPAPNSD